MSSKKPLIVIPKLLNIQEEEPCLITKLLSIMRIGRTLISNSKTMVLESKTLNRVSNSTLIMKKHISDLPLASRSYKTIKKHTTLIKLYLYAPF